MKNNMFYQDAIFLDIESQSAEDVLEFVYESLYPLGYVTEEFRMAVKEREASFPTGLPGDPYAIAVPHTDPAYIKKPFIAVIRTKNMVPFMQMGSNDISLDVKIIFVLGFKTGKHQVEILQKIIDLFVQGGLQESFLNIRTNEECLEFMKKNIILGEEVSE